MHQPCISLPSHIFGSIIQPWKSLHTIRFVGSLYYHTIEDWTNAPCIYRIAFSQWTFRVLIVEVPTDIPRVERGYSYTKFFDIFLRSVEDEESVPWWRGLERIELRTPNWVENDFRRLMLEVEKDTPRARLQSEVFPLIVFVDEDGVEQRLVEV